MNKLKTSDKQTPEAADWAEQIQQHSAFEWMMERRHYIPYLFVSLLALIAICYKLFSGSASKAESNYQLADNYWEQIQRNIQDETELDNQQAILGKLQTITSDYPELQSKYDGIIAQILLIQGETDAAMPYAARTQRRTESTLDPLYQKFSKSTLLIAQGNHQKALQTSLELKEKLLKTNEPKLLLPYLLIRIPMLYQGMGEGDLEALAWDEWRQYKEGKGLQKPSPQALETIATLFSEGGFTLDRYTEVSSSTTK